MVIRLSNHENLWRNLLRGRRKIYGRHVSGKYRVGDGEATGSRIVAVGIPAYTCLKKRGAVGSSDAGGSTRTYPGMLHKSRVLSCGCNRGEASPKLGITSG